MASHFWTITGQISNTLQILTFGHDIVQAIVEKCSGNLSPSGHLKRAKEWLKTSQTILADVQDRDREELELLRKEFDNTDIKLRKENCLLLEYETAKSLQDLESWYNELNDIYSIFYDDQVNAGSATNPGSTWSGLLEELSHLVEQIQALHNDLVKTTSLPAKARQARREARSKQVTLGAAELTRLCTAKILDEATSTIPALLPPASEAAEVPPSPRALVPYIPGTPQPTHIHPSRMDVSSVSVPKTATIEVVVATRRVGYAISMDRRPLRCIGLLTHEAPRYPLRAV